MAMRILRVGVAAVLGFLVTLPASAAPLDRPFPLAVTVEGTGQRVGGRVVEADRRGITLENASGRLSLAWQELDEAALLLARGRVLGRDDGRGWVETAWWVAERGGRGSAVESALARAVRADPAMASEAAAVRGGASPSWVGEGTGKLVPADERTPTPGEAAAAGDAAGVPETVGVAMPQRWGTLPPEVHAEGLAEQEAWLAEAMAQAGVSLAVGRDVSANFLLATDLEPAEARRWARELDRMYTAVCGMFELDPAAPLFLGKALVVIFREADDYHRWNLAVHGDPMHGTSGVCRGYGDGHVRICFYRQRDTASFAHLLVHETTHGFLHRLRSPARVPSWLNEGLAETISRRLFPEADSPRLLRRVAAEYVGEAVRAPATFFDAGNIPGPYYPVAHGFVEFLLRQDGERFRRLIDAIKDGEDATAALAEGYGVPAERLLRLYADEARR
ncbi:hypothetical protein [Phycisphaera mikurensis]|uniref:DUF1570 domain-containing protein n=1 Tax=Phycisphaera mikurensis (strain NBRC 102666 / KCTC 22515 / FYK2301M01) TaxID=1142394 RepID=I0ICA5_PHYMF|nr:hypothetical protein [Phycisphaera mikurensis]MBB6441888.1 hypothetical protein [Phycisphaera mikurensis]BAM02893.1 hypothetical protein PSMK_07340 [Phycisphaera mikurensis NBRC 102666]